MKKSKRSKQQPPEKSQLPSNPQEDSIIKPSDSQDIFQQSTQQLSGRQPSQSIILEDETPTGRGRRLQNKSFRDLIDPEQSKDGSFEQNIDANNEFLFRNRDTKQDKRSISRSHSLGNSVEEEPSSFDFQKYREQHQRKHQKKGIGLKRGITMAFPFLKGFRAFQEKQEHEHEHEQEEQHHHHHHQHVEEQELIRPSRMSARTKMVKQQAEIFNKTIEKMEKDQDPLSDLGPGILSFHQYLVYAATLLFLLTLLHIPVFNILLSYDKEYQDLRGSSRLSENDKSMLERLSIGNMGFSTSACQIEQMKSTGHNLAKLRCRTGVMTELVDFGVTTRIEDQYQCLKKRNNICNPFLKENGLYGIYSTFDRECAGKDSCIIQNFDKFVLRIGDPSLIQACFDPQSRVFFQYKCEQTEDQLAAKKNNAIVIVAIQLFCFSMIIFFIFGVQNRTNYLVNLYHTNNVQAVDYTMYMQIKKKQIEAYDEYYSKTDKEQSRGELLVDLIVKHLNEITRHSSVGGTTRHGHSAQIARVDLIYDNREMLNLLVGRGYAIKCKNKEEILRIENKIQDQKEQQYFTNIVGCFVTYQTWQDVKCIAFAKHKEEQFFGQSTHIIHAEQPQQYKWENQGFTVGNRIRGFCISMILLLSSLLFMYNLQFQMQKTIAYFDNFEKYDCNIYESSIALAHQKKVKNPSVFTIPNYSEQRYQREAFNTWKDFYQPESEQLQIRRYVNGTLGCFCDKQFSHYNALILFINYRSDGLDQDEEQLKKWQEAQLKKDPFFYDDVQTEKICQSYMIYAKLTSYYYLFMCVFIILYNIFLYMFIAPILNIAGFHQQGTEDNFSTLIVAICYLVDCMLIPIMIGANFLEYDDNVWLNKIFTGKNTDFGKDWYPDVGYQLLVTMNLFVTTPFVSLSCEWGDLLFRRWWRRKHIYKDHETTKYDQNDLLKYLDLQAGPEYIMDYKIANTTTILFVSTVLGPILPLLYPIGLFACVIQYTTEKMSLDRFYRLPKKQDESVTLTNIKMLIIAPILGLSVSIWALGNRQMFDNVIDPIQSQGQIIYSHHLIGDWKNMIPDYPHIKMLFIGLIAAIIVITGTCIYQYVKWEFYDKKKTFRVIPKYTSSLNIQTCEEFYKDENLFRDKGGFKILSEPAYNKIYERIKKHEEEDAHSCHLDDNLLKPPEQIVPGPAHKRHSVRRGVNFKDDVEHREVASRESVTSHDMREQGNFNYLIGIPSYSCYDNLYYQMLFNNQNPNDEECTKLLLQLPMMKEEKVKNIKLHHMKIWEERHSNRQTTNEGKSKKSVQS